jgi:hypothetical protein
LQVFYRMDGLLSGLFFLAQVLSRLIWKNSTRDLRG